jgi:flagellar protein FlaG
MNNDLSTPPVRPERPNAVAPVPVPQDRPPVDRAEKAQPSKQEPGPDPFEVRRRMGEASEQLNRQMAQSKRDLSFSVDDVANKIVLTVKDQRGEVVRQIPSETALRLAHNLEAVKGLLRDEQV